MLELEVWEVLIREAAIGSFFGGIFLFIITVFTAGLNFTDHDIAADHDLDLDADVDVDADVGGGFHVGSEHSFSGDAAAPVILIISTFLLTFGSLGYALYSIEINPILRLLFLIGIPFMAVKSVSFVWRKYLSKYDAYEVPKVKVDNQVKTLTTVDEKGGLVLADTSDINRVDKTLHLMGNIKLQARTRNGVFIKRNEIAYIIEITGNNTLIIDKWPNPSLKR